jgi:hypothetical protein
LDSRPQLFKARIIQLFERVLHSSSDCVAIVPPQRAGVKAIARSTRFSRQSADGLPCLGDALRAAARLFSVLPIRLEVQMHAISPDAAARRRSSVCRNTALLEKRNRCSRAYSFTRLPQTSQGASGMTVIAIALLMFNVGFVAGAAWKALHR